VNLLWSLGATLVALGVFLMGWVATLVGLMPGFILLLGSAGWIIWNVLR